MMVFLTAALAFSILSSSLHVSASKIVTNALRMSVSTVPPFSKRADNSNLNVRAVLSKLL